MRGSQLSVARKDQLYFVGAHWDPRTQAHWAIIALSLTFKFIETI